MSNRSYAVSLNNHFQNKQQGYALSMHEDRNSAGEWVISYKGMLNNEVKGQATAVKKHDAKEAAAQRALQALGVDV
ncbi:hypothetical protein BC835DRAFT_1416238 [Cytidiella melzeri]|nr:hypothetical protein BC835DRAFT_1416238 [Cytidiella melzeri]